MVVSLPNSVVRKKPAKVSIFGIVNFTLIFGMLFLLFPSFTVRFVAVFGYLSCLAFLLIKSLFAPYFGGIDLIEGRVETVTAFGGILSIPVDNIDLEKSTLSAAGLLLVPHSGEELFLHDAEYAEEELLRVAHYVGLTNHGWSQQI